jgi:hypothetical protein
VSVLSSPPFCALYSSLQRSDPLLRPFKQQAASTSALGRAPSVTSRSRRARFGLQQIQAIRSSSPQLWHWESRRRRRIKYVFACGYSTVLRGFGRATSLCLRRTESRQLPPLPETATLELCACSCTLKQTFWLSLRLVLRCRTVTPSVKKKVLASLLLF